MAMSGQRKTQSKLILALVASACVLIVAGAVLAAVYFKQASPSVSGQETFPPSSKLPSQKEMEEFVAGDLFFDGIYLDGVSLGGMTYSQAQAAFQDKQTAFENGVCLTLQYGEQTWTLTRDDFTIIDDTQALLDQAYAIGRSGAMVEDNYAQVLALQSEPVHLSTTCTVSCTGLEALLADICAQVEIPAQDAAILGYEEKTGFTYADEVLGQAVDTQALQNDIELAIAQGNLTSVIQIATTTQEPAITKAYLQENYTLMSEFSTVAKRDKARNTNIELALSSFNGKVLAPGEEFSFNKTTGERTTDKGYQVAGVILGGTSSEDIGGGVCQVSSTLFNAVVRAGLEVVTRHPHSWPSDYIGAGKDAMVNWPDSDFVFRNSSTGSIYLASGFDWDTRTLTIRIYGVPIYDPALKVDLRTECTEKIPQPDPVITLSDNLYEDQIEVQREGRSGSRWVTYRQFFDAEGNLVREEELCKTYYRAIATKITMGTKVRTGTTPVYDPETGTIIYQ